MVVLDETFAIAAERAVSMLAASVLIAADTLAMSALITVESAVSADTASALIVAERAVFAEIAFEMAGLDVAVEAFAAADTQFEARFDSTPIADRASAFSTAESAVSMLAVSVLIAALTEARSALMTTLIARSALRASAFNTALRAVSMLAASVLIAALTLAMSVLIAALVEAMWDASSARIAAETDVRSAFRTTLVEARCEA